MKEPIGLLITDTHLSETTLEVNFSVFQQAAMKCKELGLNRLWHGGDIFNSRKGQPEIVVNAWKAILDMLATMDITLIVIAGNHDKTSYVTETSYLDAFTSHPNLIVMTPYGHYKHGNIEIHFMPYYDEDLMYQDMLKEVECEAGFQHLLITHVAINGVTANGGKVVKNELATDQFHKFDLVLVGHYHNRQVMGFVVYTGSAYQGNFGEDENKGVTIVYDDLSYEFARLDTPVYKTLEIDASEVDNKLFKLLEGAENTTKIRLKISGDCEDAMVHKLEGLGVKVERIKDDYEPTDTIHAEAVQATSTDIVTAYEEWAKKRNIEIPEFGLKLLQKHL